MKVFEMKTIIRLCTTAYSVQDNAYTDRHRQMHAQFGDADQHRMKIEKSYCMYCV